MSTKKKPESVRERTILIITRKEFAQKLNERIYKGQELLNREIQTSGELEGLSKDFYNWNDFNKELLKQSFNNPDNEYYYKYSRLNTMSGFLDYARGVDTNHPQYKLENLKIQIETCLNDLNQLIEKSELIEDTSVGYATETKSFYNIGFVVHGHDEVRKYEVARFIEKDLKKKATILHDEINKGRTIIEKFEANSFVDFAVALWTSDDTGKGKKESDLKDRARQNVIFETGFFVGKLGRSSVIVLYEHGVEIPSDYMGVVFIPFDGNWKNELRKEIEAIYNL